MENYLIAKGGVKCDVEMNVLKQGIFPCRRLFILAALFDLVNARNTEMMAISEKVTIG